MHSLRLIILALVGSLSLTGRPTTTTGSGNLYVASANAAASGGGPVQSGSGALVTALRQPTVAPTLSRSAVAGLQLGSRSEAQPFARQDRGLWLPPPSEIPAFEPPPAGEEPPPAPLEGGPRFLGQSDDDILSRICDATLKTLKPLGGGASITLKAGFEGGAQAAIKPEQLRVTRYQSEVAAYRLARALGLGMVPPSCVRKIAAGRLMDGMPKALVERMQQELIIDKDGLVACAVIAWVPHLHGLRLEELDWWKPLLLRGAAIPAAKRQRVLDISTLLLFDYLIINHDRWSGGNTHETDGKMVYIDQGAGFGSERHHRRSHLALNTLKWSERFSRPVAENLFALDVDELVAELKPVLSQGEIDGVVYRLEHARHYLRHLKRQTPADSLLDP
jgi:hypothetical protein